MENKLIKSINSNKIHTPGCKWIRRMKKENREFISPDKIRERERERERDSFPAKNAEQTKLRQSLNKVTNHGFL